MRKFFVDSTPERDRSVLLLECRSALPARHVARVFDEASAQALADLLNASLALAPLLARVQPSMLTTAADAALLRELATLAATIDATAGRFS